MLTVIPCALCRPQQDAAKEHDSCTNNLYNALADLGLSLTNDPRYDYYTPAPFNLWMNVAPEPDHTGCVFCVARIKLTPFAPRVKCQDGLHRRPQPDASCMCMILLLIAAGCTCCGTGMRGCSRRRSRRRATTRSSGPRCAPDQAPHVSSLTCMHAANSSAGSLGRRRSTCLCSIKGTSEHDGVLDLTMQMDMVAAMSACPWDLGDMNGPGGKPQDCHFQVFSAA